MNQMTRRWCVAIVTALAMTLGFVAPASASASELNSSSADADAGAGEVSVKYASTFEVVNATVQTMIYLKAEPVASSWSTGLWFDDNGPAAIGTRFVPASKEDFALTWWFATTNAGNLFYQFGDDPDHVVVVNALVKDFAQAMSCSSVPADLVCTVQGLTATITTKNPTSYTITGADRQRQADLLNALCSSGTPLATCSFAPKGELMRSYGEPRMIGENRHFNCKAEGIDTVRLTWGFEESSSNSVGGSLTIGGTLFKIVEVAVELTYTHTWSWTKTYSEAHDIQVYPGKWAWMEQYPPRIAVTGDFTATIGNVTLYITDVTFDAPDGDSQGLIVSKSRDLTPDDYAKYCL
ncbi:hypothetical protein [Microbacterium rhizomatis]|uniref:Uncharacterized protein n=1 Tax=Microbacterium rhizomatis TaxID=1631477 RepID=A0A5J5J242_9MICO|nr:hypothetical protein [Microbacterium rhizomatis]KAA9108074.1 hypothetical protein F6B43_11715 [Microbacterium rhizomatis]